jgi:cytochrome c biogenesis protein CcdA
MIKRKIIVLLGLVLFSSVLFAAKLQSSKVLIEYFYQPDCEDCRKVSEFILKPMNEKYAQKILLRKYDLSNEKNFLLMISILDKLHDNSNANVYIILNRNKVFAGYSTIKQGLFKAIEHPSALSAPETNQDSAETMKSIGKRLKIVTVIVAGLLDGINPCVFSTLIFFMSLLAVAKIRGMRLFIIGTAYCLACFITYLLLGFGLFSVLESLADFIWLRAGLNWFMIIVLLIFAIISFRDAFVFIKSGGKADKVALQLPRNVKLLIHRFMRQGLKFKYLFTGAFFIGVVVTLLESVCTGQVYVPTLVLLSNEAGIFSKWFSYLLLYNLMFILPLIGVFALMFSGISIFKAVKLTKANLIIGKITLGLFFLTLAIIMFFVK